MTETTYDVKDSTGHRMVLDELRKQLERVRSSADVLDGKAERLFAATGILLSLMAFGQIAALKATLGGWFWLGLAVAGALYVAMYGVLTGIAGPHDYRLTMSADWDELAKRYFYESEQTIIERLISDYLTTIDAILAVNARKSRGFAWAARIFVAIVVVLLGALALAI